MMMVFDEVQDAYTQFKENFINSIVANVSG